MPHHSKRCVATEQPEIHAHAAFARQQAADGSEVEDLRAAKVENEQLKAELLGLRTALKALPKGLKKQVLAAVSETKQTCSVPDGCNAKAKKANRAVERLALVKELR